VPPREGEAGVSVVKPGDGEGGGVVAGIAGAARELAPVGIIARMARGAAHLHGSEVGAGGIAVARLATEGCVGAREGEPGGRVVESGARPSAGAVARSAGGHATSISEPGAVWVGVGMAGLAGGGLETKFRH